MSSVAAEYVHVRKVITAGDELYVTGADLKWYDLNRAERQIPSEVREQAREFVAAQAAGGVLDFDDELGFVILHRTGDTYLLLVMTWRNENELWETVYFDTGEGFELMEFPGVRKGTYCVWELGVVLHEQQAWIRYLFSDRDEVAARTYLDDRLLSGEV